MQEDANRMEEERQRKAKEAERIKRKKEKMQQALAQKTEDAEKVRVYQTATTQLIAWKLLNRLVDSDDAIWDSNDDASDSWLTQLLQHSSRAIPQFCPLWRAATPETVH